jgi:hypothetical protein
VSGRVSAGRRGPLSWAALFALGAALALAGGAEAQDLRIPAAVPPKLPAQAADADGFVPQGWALERKASGDLNGDGLPDLVLVLHQRDPKNIVPVVGGLGENPLDTNPRILSVAVNNGTGGAYSLVLTNMTLIPRRDDPVLADPLPETAEIAIRRRALRISLQSFASAGGWDMSTVAYSFRFQSGRLELIGYDRDTTARNTGETNAVSINYLARKMKRTMGNIASDATKIRWMALPPRALLTIDQVGDGLAFDPEH